jgi:hypothetical protein
MARIAEAARLRKAASVQRISLWTFPLRNLEAGSEQPERRANRVGHLEGRPLIEKFAKRLGAENAADPTSKFRLARLRHPSPNLV